MWVHKLAMMVYLAGQVHIILLSRLEYDLAESDKVARV